MVRKMIDPSFEISEKDLFQYSYESFWDEFNELGLIPVSQPYMRDDNVWVVDCMYARDFDEQGYGENATEEN